MWGDKLGLCPCKEKEDTSTFAEKKKTSWGSPLPRENEERGSLDSGGGNSVYSPWGSENALLFISQMGGIARFAGGKTSPSQVKTFDSLSKQHNGVITQRQIRDYLNNTPKEWGLRGYSVVG